MLDEKFGLRERATTSFTLTPEQRHLPMGQALLLDADQRVSQLDVRSRIGVPIGWTAALVPVCLLLTLAAVLVPNRVKADNPDNNSVAVNPVQAAEISKEMKKLEEVRREEKEKRQRQPVETIDAKELEEIEAELEKITSGPRDNEEQLRERFKEASELEDRLSKKAKELADKEQAQQEQLDRLAKKPKKEGPASEMQDALSRNDLNKAREEAERLADELEQGQLSKEEQQQLKEQMEDLEKDLERLSRLEDEKQELMDLKDQGEIDEETLDREMDQLQQKEKDLKELEEMAQEMKECEGGLDGQDCKKAARAMRGVARKLKNMNGQKQEQNDLAKLSRQMQQAKKSMAGGLPGGRRPVAEERETKAQDSKVTTPTDPKGKRIVTGHGPPGRNFKPKSSEEMSKDIKQAAQDAPAAIVQQRVPKGASDIAKGFFETLGGQKDGESKKKTNP